MVDLLGTSLDRTRRGLAAFGGVVLFAAAGCSGDEPEAAAPPATDAAETVQDWLSARASGDHERACELMTTEFSEELVMSALEEGGTRYAYCEDALQAASIGDLAGGVPTSSSEFEVIERGGADSEVIVEFETLRMDGSWVVHEYLLVPVDGEWRVADHVGARDAPEAGA